MSKVKKAVIPAAGLGTRVLPASKSMPKEMLPIVDKPAIQYIVEEAAAAGIEDILIITNRGKGIIEDHFDHSIELEERLAASGKTDMLEEVQRLSHLANIHYIRQRETKGLGHAVACARAFVGNEPFAVLYGDDVIIGKNSACGQLCRVYEEFGQSVVGIKEVTPEQVLRYCSLAVDPVHDNIYRVSDMIEKPKPEQVISLFAILGRCVLTPDVFARRGRRDPADRRDARAGPRRTHDGHRLRRHALRHGQQAGYPAGQLRGRACPSGSRPGLCRLPQRTGQDPVNNDKQQALRPFVRRACSFIRPYRPRWSMICSLTTPRSDSTACASRG